MGLLSGQLDFAPKSGGQRSQLAGGDGAGHAALRPAPSEDIRFHASINPGSRFWDELNPQSQLGLMPAAGAPTPVGAPPGIARNQGPIQHFAPWHPGSALFWVGALLLVTAGAMAASTSVRVGPVRAELDVGKTKKE